METGSFSTTFSSKASSPQRFHNLKLPLHRPGTISGMLDGESGSITWLGEDPFPQLKTRDLLLGVSQGVVGGKPTLDIAVENLGLSDEEERMTLSCLQLTDRLDAELTSAIPSPFYAYFWAHVSLVLRSHSHEGKLGHSLPAPGSDESDEEQ